MLLGFSFSVSMEDLWFSLASEEEGADGLTSRVARGADAEADIVWIRLLRGSGVLERVEDIDREFR